MTSVKSNVSHVISTTLFILIGFVVLQIPGYIMSLTIELSGIDYTHEKLKFTRDNIASEIVISMVLAPIIETLIFQTLVLEKSKNLRIYPKIAIVLLSIILFAVGHIQDKPTIIWAFMMGIALCSFYICIKKISRYRALGASVSTILLHALHNGIYLVEAI